MSGAQLYEGAERRSQRAQISAEAGVRIGLARGSVEVVDLSLTGVKIRTLNPLTVGTRLWLKLPAMEAMGVLVVWYRTSRQAASSLGRCILR